MVIQANMSPKAIIKFWEETREIFEKYNVPQSEKSLQDLVESHLLTSLLSGLNSAVGSSNLTCVEGG
ncbi:hypothetical protein J7E63_29370 [Bacillus sp. ISL-75]|uniref:hypothetical protein n=1 Tax=Bacillus sp. ISL-75 TaxID=2819137 RepID=UPI001BE8FA87|nr:hypothetical protein [Bacillus sp. ISL-75]MBT2730923.1 hypothetical protein [Bacillus sp. ISL-75]